MSVTVPLHSIDEEQLLLGQGDCHARAIRNAFSVTLTTHKGRVVVGGDEESVSDAVRVVRLLLEHIREAGELNEALVAQHLSTGRGAGDMEPKGDEQGGLGLPPGVVCRTKGQEHYVRAIQRETAVFAIGPAGTGKTYLAAACAVAALRRGSFRKIVLVRPAVEAGESLGFLPGDYVAKINPYLRPLYDAISAHLQAGRLQHFIETDVIEIAPLAFMRGRTLDKAFIILDEAQNTTPGQMKMFLTRMGQQSKMVVTGDATQIDLPASQPSGLIEAERLLRNVSGIGVVDLDRKDIVRHPLVQRIVTAYEQEEHAKERGDERPEDGRGRR
ncbi:MAG: phosphate starvation-inducible PhoH-like protein [Pseudohongiellaceae bacterium]|jgi:phosphate starvation-inducible PhoH-like protein